MSVLFSKLFIDVTFMLKILSTHLIVQMQRQIFRRKILITGDTESLDQCTQPFQRLSKLWGFFNGK